MANSSIGYEAFLREKIRLAPLSGFACFICSIVMFCAGVATFGGCK